MPQLWRAQNQSNCTPLVNNRKNLLLNNESTNVKLLQSWQQCQRRTHLIGVIVKKVSDNIKTVPRKHDQDNKQDDFTVTVICHLSEHRHRTTWGLDSAAAACLGFESPHRKWYRCFLARNKSMPWWTRHSSIRNLWVAVGHQKSGISFNSVVASTKRCIELWNTQIKIIVLLAPYRYFSKGCLHVRVTTRANCPQFNSCVSTSRWDCLI